MAKDGSKKKVKVSGSDRLPPHTTVDKPLTKVVPLVSYQGGRRQVVGDCEVTITQDGRVMMNGQMDPDEASKYFQTLRRCSLGENHP